MLLATLTANLQASYAAIQSQIEALQEQQRLIQSQLQRVGSVESKMESAAALVAEAISEIREVCPDELNSYQQTIASLFGDAPVAQLTPANDEVPNNDDWEPTEYGVEIQDEESADQNSDTVEVAAVEVEQQVETTEEVVDESPVEPSTEPSHQASPKSLHKQPTKPLKWLATKRGIDTAGMKRHEIASALVGQVTSQELEEAIAQAQAS